MAYTTYKLSRPDVHNTHPHTWARMSSAVPSCTCAAGAAAVYATAYAGRPLQKSADFCLHLKSPGLACFGFCLFLFLIAFRNFTLFSTNQDRGFH